MNHTTRTKQNFSTALFAAATTSFVTALAISALLLPNPNYQAQAVTEINLDVARQVCAGAEPATIGYGSCQSMADTIAAQRAPRPVQNELNPPYKPLSSCGEAVEYIFQDRVDYMRAVKVVYRESTNNPKARRPGSQFAGCAQLSNTLQRLFLQGPWDDPYYNVLALRDAVDNRAWGWCHWDLVNYCNAGGEF